MVKLSQRLLRLADEVKIGDRVADIGTDHGLLPIFLYENHISQTIILCDINEGPLGKARENIKACGADGLTDLRQGDGLNALAPAEVDTVIIAGMGSALMIDILKEDQQKTRSYSRLVLQPRSAPEKLRRWLCTHGFAIVGEALVVEGRYLCEIITAEPLVTSSQCEAQKVINDESLREQLRFEVSPLLFERRDALLIAFLDRKIRREKQIIRRVAEGSGNGEHQRISLAQQRMEILLELREAAGRLL